MILAAIVLVFLGILVSWHYIYSALDVYLDYELQEVKSISECGFITEDPNAALAENLIFIRIIDIRFKSKYLSEKEYLENYGLSLTRVGLLHELLGDNVRAEHEFKLAKDALSKSGYYLSFDDLKSALSISRQKKIGAKSCISDQASKRALTLSDPHEFQ